MPKFRVKHTFKLENRSVFYLAGEILDGVIRVGMVVHLKCNSAVDMKLPIRNIDFADRFADGKCYADVCLGIEADPVVADILSGINSGNEIFNIAED